MPNLLLPLLVFLMIYKNQFEESKSKDYSKFHVEAKQFCRENGFSQEYYFLVDLSIHSGKNRFYVYDFKQNKILLQNLVTHGSCDVFEDNLEKYHKPKFDSRVDSHCSMKGKFKIGAREYSSWGINIKYWLHGLEKVNKTAEERVVVLHSWSKVANKEIYPLYSPLSWGCPAVSNEFMQKLDEKLKDTKTPVLLWIIE